MYEKGVYRVSGRLVKIEKGVSVRDFLFNGKKDMLIDTNHADQIVVVKGEESLLSMSYDEMKDRVRSLYAGRTVFPLIENCEDVFNPIGSVTFSWEMVVMVDESGKRTYFLGDEVRPGTVLKSKKLVRMGRVFSVSQDGIETIFCFIVDDEKERREIERAIRYGVEVRIRARGMDIWVGKKNGKAQRMFLASEFEVVEEQYDDIIPLLQRLSSVYHMMVWRDLGSGRVIPSYVESAIILAALFFSYEGFAAINLIILGSPGTGKSHLLDTIAYLTGTKSHNCMETTLKGLVFSHAEKGGVYGVLYREKFVALLNEFMRIVSGAKREATREDVRRLLSTLNDAVEKKKDRSRSSGLVAGADATMVCSMITSDNFYPSVVDSFVDAMLDDPSYMRRYAFLKLSEETQERGRNFTRVPDWREETDKMLKYRGLGHGKWYKVLRFWRSQIKEAMKLDMRRFMKYARAYKEYRLKKIFFKDADQQVLNADSEAKSMYMMANEADFSQLAIACACSVAIMGSTFRNEELELPEVVLHREDEALIYAMIRRLIGDTMDLIEMGVMKRSMSGIQRSGW